MMIRNYLVAANISLALLLTSCSHFAPEMSLKEVKRSWVRRLVSESAITKTSIAQTAPPVIYGDKVIAGTSFNDLFKINRFGQLKKIKEIPDGITSISNPFQDYIFIGTQKKEIHCLNLETNEVLWKATLDSASESFSVLDNGAIYTLTESGTLYAINTSDGNVIWRVQMASNKDLEIRGAPKPIVWNKHVYAGFPSGQLLKVNRTNGAIEWQVKLSTDSANYTDIQYLEISSDRKTLFAGVFDEAVYKVDMNNGNVLWQAFEKPTSGFSFDTDNMYFSSSEGDLIKLKSSTGTLLKKEKVFKGLGGKPLIVNQNLYAIDSKGPLYRISKKSFEKEQVYEFLHQTSAQLTYDSVNRSVYALTNKGYLFKLKGL